MSTYYELDVETGALKEGPYGALFSVSPNGAHLVYDELRPRGSPEPPVVLLDGQRVYPPEKDGDERDMEEFVWAPDSEHFAFIETEGGENPRIVVVQAAHPESDVIRLWKDAAPAELRWLDSKTLSFASEGGAFYTVDVKSHAMEEVDEKTWLRAFNAIEGRKQWEFADLRCVAAPTTPSVP